MTFKPLVLAAMISTLPMPTAHARMQLAVMPFDFTDTSNEPSDQTAAHDRRLAELVGRFKQELTSSGKFDLVEAACADNQCRPEDTLAKAKSEGKRYVVFGAVQKSSSLVLWAKVDVVDTSNSKLIFTRWITFRGDTDEAWTRTGRYIAREMNRGK